MALQLSYNFRGLTVPKAYVRIENITGDKRYGFNGTAAIYADAQAAQGVQPAVPAAPVTQPAMVGTDGVAMPTQAAPMPVPTHAMAMPVMYNPPIETFNVSATWDPKQPNILDSLYAVLLKKPGFEKAVKV